MNDPSSPAVSDAPPVAAGQSHSATALHAHPLWQQAAGRGRPSSMGPPPARGRGRGRGSQAAPDPDSGARYERISLLAVELQQGATGGDGADSVLLSSDEDDGPPTRDKKKKHADREVEDSDADDYERDYREDSEASDDDEDKRNTSKGHADAGGPSRKKQRYNSADPWSAQPEDMMAAAAFGGNANMFGEMSDTEGSVVSQTSSKQKRDTYKKAFPVKGVTCVGCALSNRIAPVERFVNNYVGRMSENALWKMAALTWRRDVMEPAKREGVVVVDWPWRDVANHFRLHTTNPIVGRTHMIQSLTAMRCQVEQRLVRVENGERELDKTNADLCLKVRIAALGCPWLLTPIYSLSRVCCPW